MELKILIVDDDKMLLSVLKTTLEDEGHKVMTCGNGVEAIAKCRAQNFDLIITDLKMPGASGLEVLSEALKISPEILVILVTGYGTLESATQAIRQGAYDYLTKPFKLEEIKIVVNNAGDKIRLYRENQKLINELQDAYKQLQIMKKIIEGDLIDKKEKNSNPDPTINAPFIAGSMVPLYYAKKREGIDPITLSALERISDLKEKGFLSDDEFNLCKSTLFKAIKQ